MRTRRSIEPSSAESPPYETQELVAIDTPMVALPDRVLWLDAWQGVLHVRRLEDLRPAVAVLTPLSRSADGRIPLTQELSFEQGALTVATWPERESIDGHQEMEWKALHEERRRRARVVEIPLPPVTALPDREVLRSRWRTMLPAATGDTVLDVVGEPWLSPAAIASGYTRWPRPSMQLPAKRLAASVRTSLPQCEVVHGWPDQGSQQERTDRVFASAVSRASSWK